MDRGPPTSVFIAVHLISHFFISGIASFVSIGYVHTCGYFNCDKSDITIRFFMICTLLINGLQMASTILLVLEFIWNIMDRIPVNFDVYERGDSARNYGVHVFATVINTFNETMCSVCQENLQPNDNVVRMRCKHILHAVCARQCFAARRACPICRAPVTHRFVDGVNQRLG